MSEDEAKASSSHEETSSQVSDSSRIQGGYRRRTDSEDKTAQQEIEEQVSQMEKDLEDDVFLQYFKRYLDRTFSTENLEFFVESKKWLKDFDGLSNEQKQERGQHINSTFIEARSKFELNLDIFIRQKIKARIAQDGFRSKNTFLEAHQQVFNFLVSDCHPKFVASDLYEKYKAKEPLPERGEDFTPLFPLDDLDSAFPFGGPRPMHTSSSGREEKPSKKGKGFSFFGLFGDKKKKFKATSPLPSPFNSPIGSPVNSPPHSPQHSPSNSPINSPLASPNGSPRRGFIDLPNIVMSSSGSDCERSSGSSPPSPKGDRVFSSPDSKRAIRSDDVDALDAAKSEPIKFNNQMNTIGPAHNFSGPISPSNSPKSLKKKKGWFQRKEK